MRLLRLFSPGRMSNYLFEAGRTLSSNKLRSFLSILGVMIGVAAVIAMLAVGSGANQQVQQSLANLGTNLIMVRTSFVQRGISMGMDTTTRFTFADYEALKKIDGVKTVVPYVQGRIQSVYQNRNWNTQVLGASPDYQSVRSSIPQAGRVFFLLIPR